MSHDDARAFELESRTALKRCQSNTFTAVFIGFWIQLEETLLCLRVFRADVTMPEQLAVLEFVVHARVQML